ncbi:cold-responsive protein kinase 1-like [Apium graveolens]|uniref:cold-responsive protein kinase 1-like n=1 Tax=Apium graveolens TaxID=4045 RepID=UPI003D79346F
MPCFNTCFGKKVSCRLEQPIDVEEEVSRIQNIKLYPYKELQIATSYFNAANKIGEGGFGSVYKGKLKDGTLVAIKVLSAESRQGVREFLTELVTISDIEHENLVEIYGCCVEGVHRILVYGYLENNSLAQTLLGDGHCTIEFSWKRRTEICIGIARGLAYLHEDIQPRIVHRDIKASNILLDKNLTAKISDFGIAKLLPAHLSHITTQVAGTLGYLAPEYATRGRLTRKADVYSLGILILEIVCGRRNRDSRLPSKQKFLLEMAWELYQERDITGLVDASLNGNFSVNEASRYIKIAFLCTQDDPKSRPSMSTIVNMLKGDIDVEEIKISKPGLLSELPRKYRSSQNESSTGLGNPVDAFLSVNETMSYGTITFTNIEDRRS